MRMKTIITITRQMGSAGSYLGQLIAKNLGIRYIDKEILSLAAQEFGVDPSILIARAEKISSFWQKTLQGFTFGSPESHYTPPLSLITDQNLFNKQAEIIKTLTKENSCVIVGWSGAYLLPRHSKTTAIFCHAPLNFRIDRVMKVYKAKDEKSAKEVIEKSDEMRRKYIARMTGKDWSCAENYDISVNTSLLSLEKLAELTIELIKQ